MTERRHGLRALGTTLPTLTKRAFGRRGFAEGGLALDWASIVGEEIAANTLPLKVSYPRGARLGGTLHLKVTSGYAVIIGHCEPQLLERVNAYLGYGAVERLKLTHGHRAEPPAKPEVAAQLGAGANYIQCGRFGACRRSRQLRQSPATKTLMGDSRRGCIVFGILS